MMRFLSFAAIVTMPLTFLMSAPADDEVAAHRAVFELAGAFSNDGFKLRDGYWSGPIRMKQSHLIQVNLYAGNQYWFCAGATEPAKKLLVSVFDEEGKPVNSELIQKGATSAAGFSPTSSGAYVINIQEIEGDPASFCFLYSYK